MRKKIQKEQTVRSIILMLSFIVWPILSQAQTVADNISSLQTVLDKVYTDMLPMCSKLIDIGRAIAGFGALWYIALRAWKQIASASPIDFYPMLRPFALGMAIMAFPTVITMLNGVLNPIVSATGDMLSDSKTSIIVLLKLKQELLKNTDDWKKYMGQSDSEHQEWYQYSHPNVEAGNQKDEHAGLGIADMFSMEKQLYIFRNSIKEWLSQVLEILYAAAALCINTVRVFFLIMLAIVGPLVFGFAVFDVFKEGLSSWFARYINTFLWLPVANIFGSILGKIQVNMLRIDIHQINEQGHTSFSATDSAYLIFLIIGIFGYACVPFVSGWIIHVTGGNALLSRVNAPMDMAKSVTTSMAMSSGGMAAGGTGQLTASGLSGSVHSQQGSSGSSTSNFFKDRLAGN